MKKKDSPEKERITIKLDVDVIAHFKAESERTLAPYQTLINAALRKQVQLDQCIANVASSKEN